MSDSGRGASARRGVELRVVLPPEALAQAPRPEFFSQHNCELLGLTKRTFLELLRREDAPEVSRVGKLRLVRREAMLNFLDGLATVDGGSKKKTATSLDSADQLLVDLGCTPGAADRSE